MGYSREVYDAAMAELNRRKNRAEQEAQERKNAFYQICPRAREIQQQLASTASQTARVVFSGGNTAQAMERLREKSLELQKERETLLLQVGLEKDALLPRYRCSHCQDTGYIDGKMCDCLKGLLRQEAYRSLNEMTPLTLSGFDQFQLRYYSNQSDGGEPSPRAHMAQIFSFCQEYAAHFSQHAESLLFQGRTGLGKTHLSLAIARKVIEKGFGVVYGSVQNFVSTLEKERFGRSDADSDTNQTLLHCDLLILDDLGTEFSTSFVTAALYNLINTRLMAEKPTIISTNLSMKELLDRYGERMVSRMIGGYIRFEFAGKDIRQLKNREKEQAQLREK